MASSVDLPAPLGPSSATISPGLAAERDSVERPAPSVAARDVGETREVKVHARADHAAWRSIFRVDALEGRHELCPPRRIRLRVHAAGTMLLLE